MKNEKRNSLSKEQQAKNASRRASMLVTMDKSKMNLTDHRQSTSG